MPHVIPLIGPKMTKLRKSLTARKRTVRYLSSTPSSQEQSNLNSLKTRNGSSPVPPLASVPAMVSVAAASTHTDDIFDNTVATGPDERDAGQNNSKEALTQLQSSSLGLSFKPTFLRQSEAKICTLGEEIHDVCEPNDRDLDRDERNQAPSSSSPLNKDISALFGSPHSSNALNPIIPTSYSPAKHKGSRHSLKRDSLNSLNGILRKVLNNSKADLIWMMNIGKIHDKRSMQGGCCSLCHYKLLSLLYHCHSH